MTMAHFCSDQNWNFNYLFWKCFYNLYFEESNHHWRFKNKFTVKTQGNKISNSKTKLAKPWTLKLKKTKTESFWCWQCSDLFSFTPSNSLKRRCKNYHLYNQKNAKFITSAQWVLMNLFIILCFYTDLRSEMGRVDQVSPQSAGILLLISTDWFRLIKWLIDWSIWIDCLIDIYWLIYLNWEIYIDWLIDWLI